MTAPGKRRQRVHLLSEQPTLLPGQHVAQIVQALGENTYEVLLADGSTSLYRLPKRLRQVAYIRRGSFVFVRDQGDARSRVAGEIETLVLSTFLPSISKEDFWPERFRRAPPEIGAREKLTDSGAIETAEEERSDEETEEEWNVGEGNPNRNGWDHQASSSEESSSDEDDR